MAGVVLWVSIGVLRGDPGDDWPDRGQPALAWTGDQLFVFGGNPVPGEGEDVRTLEPLNDAALIDPASDEVDVLPDPPFERPLRTQPAAIAVDDEVLVIGQVCRETEEEDRACEGGAYRAAMYSVPERAWRAVELPGQLERVTNGQAEPVGTTSDGRAVVILGTRDGFGALANRELWTYSPEEGDWEELPSTGAFIEGACLAGDVVVVGSGLLAETAAGGSGPVLQVMDLNAEARTWFPTPPAETVPTGDTTSMTCGDELVLVDDRTPVKQIFQLGPGGGWRQSAERPGDDVYQGRLWTGEEFLFLDPGSPTLAYDPEADAWRGIEGSAPTGGRSVWTGELVVGWPGRTDLPVSFPVDGEG